MSVRPLPRRKLIAKGERRTRRRRPSRTRRVWCVRSLSALSAPNWARRVRDAPSGFALPEQLACVDLVVRANLNCSLCLAEASSGLVLQERRALLADQRLRPVERRRPSRFPPPESPTRQRLWGRRQRGNARVPCPIARGKRGVTIASASPRLASNSHHGRLGLGTRVGGWCLIRQQTYPRR
jgi:hypothetical protein